MTVDIAYCTANQTRYDIITFSNLDDNILSLLRRSLVCNKCGGKGYYRKKSRDGKPACFGAYHEDNCEYKMQGTPPKFNPETEEEVNTIVTNHQTINIIFKMCSNIITHTPNTPTSDEDVITTNVAKRHTLQPAKNKELNKSLRSILKMLMESDDFKSSNIEIHTGAKHPFKAKNLFIHFDDAKEEHLNKWKGYYGIISHANSNITWLNVANEKDISIPISNINKQIIKRYKINSSENLAGASILVFGRLKFKKSLDNDIKGKWYIAIQNDNLEHIYIKINPN